jgi:2-hydroxy-3-oxopropionate reductase
MKVGFIGLGAMGLPMARNVLKAGHDVFTLIHRRRQPAEELHALGAHILSSPAEVARRAEVVITVLPADAELESVAAGARGVLEGITAGKTLVEMTSAKPETLTRLVPLFTKQGARILDAPVSGGTAKAASGELTIMAGGDAGVLEEMRPLLHSMGKEIFHVGGIGQGKTVKMVNQLLAAIHIAAIGECFALGVKNGADPETLYRVISAASGYSRMMDLRLPGFLFLDNFTPGFTFELMAKDVGIAIDSARTNGCPVPLGSAVAELFAAAAADTPPGTDFSAVARYAARLAGATLARTKA